MRPGSEPAPAQWSDVDEMTQVDGNGNYINQPAATDGAPPPAKAPYEPTASPLRQDENGEFYYGPADVGRSVSEYRSYLMMSGISGESLDRMVTRLEQGLMRRGNFRYASGRTAADIGAMTSDYREALIEQGETGERLNERVNTYENTLKRIVFTQQRMSDAGAAARGATKQRLTGMVPRTDRFRPRDNRGGGEVERIRTTEAMREYARGIADVYRRVADRRRTAVVASGDPDQQRFVNDALMRAAPTPAETVTEIYAFSAGVDRLAGDSVRDRFLRDPGYYIDGQPMRRSDIEKRVREDFMKWGSGATDEEVNRTVDGIIQRYNEGGNAYGFPPGVNQLDPDAMEQPIPMSSLRGRRAAVG